MKTSLLLTKLYIPPPRPNWVRRCRLIERLHTGLTRRLTLISAPAGSGKTTLLSEWVWQVDRPVAWLSLDQDDDDPTRFWRYVIAALQTVDPTVGQFAQAVLESAPSPSINEPVATLINDIATLHVPLILILDDYHTIQTASIHDSLNLLLDHLPSQLHVAIATRADPPLALAHRRGRSELTEIRVRDLRFTLEEATAFLNAHMGLNLAAGDIVALENRTEGWIVGLQMAALSLQNRTPLDQRDFVTTFAGDDRYIVDYLVQEVFQHQPPRVQAFLLQTSVLERLCGSLCDAVTGRDDGQEILDYLERANLFTIPLDNRRYWYRYHRLFTDLLRQRLSQSKDKGHIDTLYRRASTWCQHEGLIAEAVSYVLMASDTEYAATLIEQYVLDLFFHSEISLVHSWIKALPGQVVRSRPLLQAICASTTVLLSGYSVNSIELAESWLQEAERTITIQARDAGDSDVPGRRARGQAAGFISNFRAYLSRFRGDAPQVVVDLSQRALDHLPEGEKRFRSALLTNLGYAYLDLGDEDAADRAFSKAKRIGELNDDLFNAAAATREQALIARKRGRLREAAAICREYLRFIDSRGGERDRLIPYAGVVYITLGDILLEWNDLEEAEHLLTQGLNLVRSIAHFITIADGYIALARLRRAQGDVEKALETLEGAEWLSPAALSRITAYRSRLWLAQAEDDPGKLARVTQWASEHQVTLENDRYHDPFKHLEQIALYRLLIAQYRTQGYADLRPLLDCLDRQLYFAKEKSWNEWTIRLLILRALTLYVRGSVDQAIVSLQQALALGEPEGYVRIFLDEGAPLLKLLHEIAARGPATEYVSQLLAAAFDLREIRPQARPAPSEILIEPLSSRELEVLRLVAAGDTNPQIAQRLFVTVGTVKKHLTHVFGKLGVKNRVQATARARKLGLLE
jgi:LuxR family maltose regulon positive regulatory protein